MCAEQCNAKLASFILSLAFLCQMQEVPITDKYLMDGMCKFFFLFFLLLPTLFHFLEHFSFANLAYTKNMTTVFFINAVYTNKLTSTMLSIYSSVFILCIP